MGTHKIYSGIQGIRDNISGSLHGDCHELLAERGGERKRWIKQDLPTTHGLVICAECDLLVEVSHSTGTVRRSNMLPNECK